MDLYHRVGMYFFTVGALIAILAGAFELSATMYDGVLVLLIFLGVFSAILNVREEEELAFLVASSAFLVMVFSFKFLLGHHELIQAMSQFFDIVTFFIGSMLSVVALKTVFEFGSQRDLDAIDHADAVEADLDSMFFSRRQRIWNFIIFLAVALTFIVILIEVFFNPPNLGTFFTGFAVLITFIFAIDLVVLYRQEGSMKKFVKNCWLDILATIPFFLIVQGVEALQIVKFARLVRISRFIKLNHTLKFMSDRSGVKHYVHGRNLFKEKIIPQKVATKKRSKTVTAPKPQEPVPRKPIRNVPSGYKRPKKTSKRKK